MELSKGYDLVQAFGKTQAFIDKATARITEANDLARAAQSPEISKAASELIILQASVGSEYARLVSAAAVAAANEAIETGYLSLGGSMEMKLAHALADEAARNPEAKLFALEKRSEEAQAQFVSATREIIQRGVTKPQPEAVVKPQTAVVTAVAASTPAATKRKRMILE